MVEILKYLRIKHTVVPVFTVSESPVYWNLIQCQWQFQHVQCVRQSTSFPNVVNALLISVVWTLGVSL